MRFMKVSMAAIAAMGFVAGTGTAQAEGNAADGLKAMQELNLIVLGKMTGGHDVEGKAFVGGDLTGNTPFGIGNKSQGLTPSDRPTLTVVGDATGGGSINNGWNGGAGSVATIPGMVVGGDVTGFTLNTQNAVVKVGGKLTGTNLSEGSTVDVGGKVVGGNANGATVNGNLGNGFAVGLLSDLGDQKSKLSQDLAALSSALGSLATTAGSGFDFTDHNNVKMKAVAGDSGFAVINVDASDFFGNISGLSYDFTPGLTTVVNVIGAGDFIWNFNTNGNAAAYNSDIIFNFADATKLNLNRMVHGSVLAPFASVINSTPIEGTLVAKTFTQGGEVHLGSFGGGISFDEPGTPPGTVPEPATWAMLIAGFGIVGVAARRRRQPRAIAA